MRKLSETDKAVASSKNNGAQIAKAVKLCGYILFLLGTATLFSVIYFYKFYTQVPVQASIIAGAELASGFFQIKCFKQAELQKISLYVSCAAAAILAIIIYLYPEMLKLPAVIGMCALVASIIISLLRLKNH